MTQLTTLLSEPACRLSKPIEIDYNFIEVEDQYLFDIAGRRFIKESGSLKGSPRAFIRYEYSESKKPNPAPFIEGTHLITLSHSLSPFITLYPLGWKATIFNWQL